MEIQPLVVEGMMNEIVEGAAEYRHLMEEMEQTKKAQALVASRLVLLRKLLALEGEAVEDVPGTFGSA